MKIQALCRDYNLRIASERNISKPAYIIPINKISDRWVKLYVSEKAKRLQAALDNNALPPVCTARSVGMTGNVLATVLLQKTVLMAECSRKRYRVRLLEFHF